jgi:hypothetical protein
MMDIIGQIRRIVRLGTPQMSIALFLRRYTQYNDNAPSSNVHFYCFRISYCILDDLNVPALLMASSEPTERTRLLSFHRDLETHSHISSAFTKEDEALANTAAGEILPYNDYSSIDFLHDLVHCSIYYNTTLIPTRSKIHTEGETFIREPASETDSGQAAMPSPAGYVSRLSAS